MLFGFEINYWVLLGFFGQLLFFARFIIQWLSSERRGESHIPVSFWYLSIAGALIILMYAIYRSDPVFILGQGFAIVIYARNLILIHGHKKKSDLYTKVHEDVEE